jgi:hypothetical protein
LADRFPLAEAIEALPVRSCVVDGEAIVCDDGGLAVFDLIRGHGTNARAILCAFDLLEVNGEDIRREPIEDRKRRLAGLLRLAHEGIALNEHFSGDGAIIYKHACALGCEGIVSIQTVSVAPGGAVITEFKTKVPDNYTLLDHAIARAERGLLGVLHVEGAPNPDIFNGEVMSGMGH